MDSTTRWETAALRDRSGRPRPRVTQATPPPPTGDDGASPDGGAGAPVDPGAENLVVPLSAWNRMIDQLGNLHQAGRELAEARERAARAETEAAFLRERLAELRSASPSVTAPTTDADAGASTDATIEAPPPTPPPPSVGVVDGARRAVSGAAGWLRRRSSRRI